MRKFVRSVSVTTALAAVVTFSTMQFAYPISAELAKKCRGLAIKSHPPATAGNKKGTAEAERDYFRACVAKGGNVDSDSTHKQ